MSIDLSGMEIVPRNTANDCQLTHAGRGEFWLRRPKRYRHRFDGSRSQYCLPVRRESYDKAMWNRQKSGRLFIEAYSWKQQMRPVVDICNSIDSARIGRLPWNIRRAYDQIKDQAWRYLLDVGHFTRTHMIKAGKILSLHSSAVACIKKGKVGKDKEFGRVFQLARIKGNFLFVLESTSLRMNDKHSFVSMLDEHQNLFGESELTSVSADKGYWSAKNLKAAAKRRVKDIGWQAPSNIKNKKLLPTKEIQEKLRDRRAGIEPLIGHAKLAEGHPEATFVAEWNSPIVHQARSSLCSSGLPLASYGSILGFNLRQLIRHQGGKMQKAA